MVYLLLDTYPSFPIHLGKVLQGQNPGENRAASDLLEFPKHNQLRKRSEFFKNFSVQSYRCSSFLLPFQKNVKNLACTKSGSYLFHVAHRSLKKRYKCKNPAENHSHTSVTLTGKKTCEESKIIYQVVPFFFVFCLASKKIRLLKNI